MQDGASGLDWFFGIIEDINDPTQQGKVRVRCYGWHELDKSKLATKDLPWAIVLQPTTSAGIHSIGHSTVGLLEGSEVFGFFADGKTAQTPIIVGVLGMTVTNQYNNSPNSSTSMPLFPNSPLLSINNNTTASTNNSVKPITNQTIIPAPISMYTIGTLSQSEVANLKGAIAISESSNNYRCVNTIGFVGKYQFGWSALITVGFCNRNAVSNASLQNPNVWTGKFGVSSLSDYFDNTNSQELGMDLLLQSNYKVLNRAGIFSADTPADVVGGYLAVAHLLGPGGAIQMKSGIVGKDGYGTSSSKYYLLGSIACKK